MTQQNKVRVPTEWRVFYNMVTPSAISVVEAKSNFEVVSASWFVRPFAVALPLCYHYVGAVRHTYWDATANLAG
jgi:succinate dehydrogenase/fumarate reductase cytochrome b subunit